jgi:hypothetical protein
MGVELADSSLPDKLIRSWGARGRIFSGRGAATGATTDFFHYTKAFGLAGAGVFQPRATPPSASGRYHLILALKLTGTTGINPIVRA